MLGARWPLFYIVNTSLHHISFRYSLFIAEFNNVIIRYNIFDSWLMKSSKSHQVKVAIFHMYIVTEKWTSPKILSKYCELEINTDLFWSQIERTYQFISKNRRYYQISNLRNFFSVKYSQFLYSTFTNIILSSSNIKKSMNFNFSLVEISTFVVSTDQILQMIVNIFPSIGQLKSYEGCLELSLIIVLYRNPNIFMKKLNRYHLQ